MRIKFFLNPFYLTDNYCPEAVQLAYGFKTLGYEVTGNIDYWQVDDGYLIPEDLDNEAYDLAIMDHRFVHHTKPWVIKHHVDAGRLGSVPKVLLERQCGQERSPQWNRDGWLAFFDLICVTDRTSWHPKHPRIISWPIGIIPEAVKEIEGHRTEKNDAVLHNFRVTHDARGQVLEALKAHKRLLRNRRLIQSIDLNEGGGGANGKLNEATGGRYNPNYFKAINEFSAFLTCGGYLQTKPFCYERYDAAGKTHLPLDVRVKRKWNWNRSQFFGLSGSNKTNVILQWDSFRWWEALCADCAPVMLDFDHWGLDLPVIPIEGEHYIGIKDLDDASWIERLGSMTLDELKKIGLAGRHWFHRHYSPSAQALRLLEAIGEAVHVSVKNR